MNTKEKILEKLMEYNGSDFNVNDELLGFIRTLDVEPSIVYLDPDSLNDIEWITNEERDRLILKHKDSQHYSLQDFVDDFNDEAISDLGVLVLKTNKI